MRRKSKPTYQQLSAQIEREASEKFPAQGDWRLKSLAYESGRLIDMVIEQKCSDIPPLPKTRSLFVAAQASGKLDPHSKLLAGRDTVIVLEKARLLVCLGLETGHKELSHDATIRLAAVYTQLSRTEDVTYGRTMMGRDVQLFGELKASRDMIEGMSHAAKAHVRKSKSDRTLE